MPLIFFYESHCQCHIFLIMSLCHSAIAVSVCYPWKLLKKHDFYRLCPGGETIFCSLLVILLIPVRSGWAQWISRAWIEEIKITGIIFPLPIHLHLVLISALYPVTMIHEGYISPPPFLASSHWVQPKGDKKKEMSTWNGKTLGNFFPVAPIYQCTSSEGAVSCDCNPARRSLL